MEQTVEIRSKINLNPSRVGKKYYVKTFGCQMNEHDSEKIAGMFELDGMIKANSQENADVLFINTCTIRENADDKLYGTLGQLKQWKNKQSDRKLLVGGCAAQKDKTLVRDRAPWVDVVIGTHNLTNIINLLNQSDDWGPLTEVVDEIEEMPTDAPSIRESEHSAWLTIQIGCNNSCTFCIVPSVRGPEISRRPSDIVNEAKQLVDSGIKEITLLGQNVNSYGRDLKIDNRSTPYFAKLLTQLNEIEGLERIRFTSPHPKDFKEETINAVKNLDKVCNQIHAPLQSGSSKLLSKMHRGYNKERFIQKIDMIKSIIPDVSLTTDIIVGFPGETDEDFNDTMDIVNYSEFDSIYMFQFSPRPGTAAYNMETEFIDKDIITKRFQHLKNVQTDISSRKLKRFVGTAQSILIEKVSKKNDQIFTGKIDSGQITHIKKSGLSLGEMVDVNIVDSTPFFLKAELI
ncbi:MAG: tRNA (N6-isopentenyl adenosine(37)-C2)-methylthiotransferase MiaB [Flavobacteriaceae bacterium]|nr:tRNA (N6-isopentenyl adenosine(37)-C2)-methylthiotransferase MiaB [Flavobacteriaceae bacterium]